MISCICLVIAEQKKWGHIADRSKKNKNKERNTCRTTGSNCTIQNLREETTKEHKSFPKLFFYIENKKMAWQKATLSQGVNLLVEIHYHTLPYKSKTVFQNTLGS